MFYVKLIGFCLKRNQLMKSPKQTRPRENHQTNGQVQRNEDAVQLQHVLCYF